MSIGPAADKCHGLSPMGTSFQGSGTRFDDMRLSGRLAAIFVCHRFSSLRLFMDANYSLSCAAIILEWSCSY